MFQMTDSQRVTVTLNILDRKGNPAPIDGHPEWAVDNPNVIALTPSGDNLSCVVEAVGPLGAARVSVTADADLGEGVTSIVGILDIEITGGAATVINLVAGTPEEIPDPAATGSVPPAPSLLRK
jgi:hypothetical protein